MLAASQALQVAEHFPIPLDAYPAPRPDLLSTLADRIAVDPFNAVASAIFPLAILHTLGASRIAAFAHQLQHRHGVRLRARGWPSQPVIVSEVLHFLGEVEANLRTVGDRLARGHDRPATRSWL